ncbi:cytokine receptor-like factor 2 [Fukomys damarensis]|uniref:cytokine receptor-like factor 2 n=1 Tax=Fukomys damarensis TaxID=885580 RepID=UPI0014554513|nr:cytokine receptor-like factor 2 [Fukomys damarensis]
MGTRVWAWVAALLLLLLLQGHPTDMGDEGAGRAATRDPPVPASPCPDAVGPGKGDSDPEGREASEASTERGLGQEVDSCSGETLLPLPAPVSPSVSVVSSAFRDDRAYAPCTTYLVQGGHTAGCLLEGADRVLDFSIHNGSRPLLSMQRWVSDYRECTCGRRPAPPLREGLDSGASRRAPLWDDHPGDPPGDGRVREPRGRTDGRRTDRRQRTAGGEGAAALSLPRRLLWGAQAPASDREPPTDRSRPRPPPAATPLSVPDSCQQTPRPPWPEWPRFSLVCSLVLLLVVAPLLLALWKAQRVKKLLMPSVPDPKGSFPGLFEHHQGDFQEWIADTQDVARWKKPPSGDQDTGSEQTLEVQLSGMDTVLPPGTGPLSPHTREQEAPPGSPQHPPQDPQGSNVISIGSFTFVMTDGAYMKL